MPSRAPQLRLVVSKDGASSRRGPRSDLDDAALVGLAKSGDMSAFEQLYRRHVSFAVNLAVRIQGTSGDVEDLVHDAFLRAHARMRELREPAAFRSWLGSIVVRGVKSRLRRRRLLATLGLASREPVELDAVASGDASPELRAELAQIYALLRTIPADDRIAWTLRFVDRHPLEQVAQLSDCSLATAKRRIARAQRFVTEHFVSAHQESIDVSAE